MESRRYAARHAGGFPSFGTSFCNRIPDLMHSSLVCFYVLDGTHNRSKSGLPPSDLEGRSCNHRDKLRRHIIHAAVNTTQHPLLVNIQNTTDKEGCLDTESITLADRKRNTFTSQRLIQHQSFDFLHQFQHKVGFLHQPIYFHISLANADQFFQKGGRIRKGILKIHISDLPLSEV